MSTSKLNVLIKQAEALGAVVTAQFDHAAMSDGLDIIEGVYIVGLEGFPVRWMSTEYAIIRLNEFFNGLTNAAPKQAAIQKTFEQVVHEMAKLNPSAKIYSFPTVIQ